MGSGPFTTRPTFTDVFQLPRSVLRGTWRTCSVSPFHDFSSANGMGQAIVRDCRPSGPTRSGSAVAWWNRSDPTRHLAFIQGGARRTSSRRWARQWYQSGPPWSWPLYATTHPGERPTIRVRELAKTLRASQNLAVIFVQAEHGFGTWDKPMISEPQPPASPHLIAFLASA